MEKFEMACFIGCEEGGLPGGHEIDTASWEETIPLFTETPEEIMLRLRRRYKGGVADVMTSFVGPEGQRSRQLIEFVFSSQPAEFIEKFFGLSPAGVCKELYESLILVEKRLILLFGT